MPTLHEIIAGSHGAAEISGEQRVNVQRSFDLWFLPASLERYAGEYCRLRGVADGQHRYVASLEYDMLRAALSAPAVEVRAYSAWLAMLPERRKLWPRTAVITRQQLRRDVYSNDFSASAPLTESYLRRAMQSVRSAGDPLQAVRDEVIAAQAVYDELYRFNAWPDPSPELRRAADRLSRARDRYEHAERVARNTQDTPVFYPDRTRPRFF